MRVHITVETDKPKLPAPFPKQAYSPGSRVQALHALRSRGAGIGGHGESRCCRWMIPGALPMNWNSPARRVILDHYLLGDGSKEGQRTNRTAFPRLLREAGYEEWTTLKKFHEIVDVFRSVFGGHERVGVSREGFNAGGNKVYDRQQGVSAGPRP